MSYSPPPVHDLYHSIPTTANPDPGTALDVTVSETATISPETTSFNSTKFPDVASPGASMSTMLLSFGIITVIGLAVAVAPEGVFPKVPKKTWKHYPGNGHKFPRATSSVRSSQHKAVEAQSLPFFPAQPLVPADRGSIYQEEEEQDNSEDPLAVEQAWPGHKLSRAAAHCKISEPHPSSGWRSYGTSSCPCTTLIPLRNRMNWSRSCWNMGEMLHLPRHRRARCCWRTKEPCRDPAALCSPMWPTPSTHDQHLPLCQDHANAWGDEAKRAGTSRKHG